MTDLVANPASAARGRSLTDDALARLRANRAATLSLAVLVLMTLFALFGPMLSPWPYDQVNKDHVWVPPLTDGHLLGTDALGRDLLARLAMGLRVSLAIGLVATLVSLVIGVAWGATAGYIGGVVDEAMMRIVDVLYALPFIFFVISALQRDYTVVMGMIVIYAGLVLLLNLLGDLMLAVVDPRVRLT